MQALLCLLFYALILVVSMTPFALSGWHARREETDELPRQPAILHNEQGD